MKKAFIPTLFFLLLTIASPAIGTWNSLPNVPATGRANGIAFSINNLVYMGTGALIGTFGNVNCFDDLWSYDPATNIWSQRASYPGGQVRGAYGFALNGQGYVGGGWEPNIGFLSSFYTYVPNTNSWNLVTSSGPILEMAGAFVMNNIAYIAGGRNSSGPTGSFIRYTGASGFINLPDIGGTSHPNPTSMVRYGAVGAGLNGLCYVGTGIGSNGAAKRDWWEYSPATNQWLQKNSFGGSSREGASAFVLGGNQLYVGLGSNPSPLTVYNDLWLYDPGTDGWVQDASLGSGLSYASATAIGSVAYVGNGTNGSLYLQNFYKFTSCPGPNYSYILPTGFTTICQGGTVQLDVFSSTFVGTNSYQWQLDGLPIPNATSSTYFASVQGDYSCKVINPCGTVTTSALTVTVITPAVYFITASGAPVICPGQTLTLNSNAAGFTPDFQWYLNGLPIVSGGQSSTLIATAPGTYTVISPNSCNPVMSAPFTVGTGTPITVSLSPAGSSMVCTGQSVILTSSASSTPTSYIWQRNGVTISGANGPSYTATVTGSYQVIATGPCGNSYSNPSVVTISSVIPTVSISSATSIVCTGSNINLSSQITGSPATYQWQRNGVNIPNANGVSYTTMLDGNYALIVTNGCGIVTSNTVTLTAATIPTSVIAASGPTDICTGGSVLLTSTVSGTAPLTYQWQLNGSDITGANNATYSATAAGTYRLMMTNICNSMFSNSISVTITNTPTVTVSASGPTTFCSGNNLVLTAVANGSNPTFQWIRNGVNIPGANAAMYTVSQSGSYTVQMTNNCGTVTSTPTSVTVVNTATASITASSPSICTGSSSLLTAAVTQPPLIYQWFQNNLAIPGATAGTYTVTTIGNYSVQVTNACGTVSSNTLSITTGGGPQATIAAQGPATFCTGGSLVITSTVTGAPVTYQWRRNGTNISGATAASYTATLTGNYTVQVTNSCGNSVSNTIIVTVLAGPPAAPGTISGPSTFCNYQTGVVYSITPVAFATSYFWTVPQNAVIVSGQGTTSITVNFGNKNGKVKVQAINLCGAGAFQQKNVTRSNCISRIEPVTTTESIAVYPNPANENLFIEVHSENEQPYTLSLMTLTGQVVFTGNGQLLQDKNKLTVDVSYMQPGIYFLTVEMDGVRTIRKVVVQ